MMNVVIFVVSQEWTKWDSTHSFKDPLDATNKIHGHPPFLFCLVGSTFNFITFLKDTIFPFWILRICPFFALFKK